MKKALLVVWLVVLGITMCSVACTSFHLMSNHAADSVQPASDQMPSSAAPMPTVYQQETPWHTEVGIIATFEPLDSEPITQAPAQHSAAPQPADSQEPIVTIQPAYKPAQLTTFSFADNDLVPVDLDYDGIFETVSLVTDPSDSLMKLVIESDSDFSLNFNISSLVCAYATDFCFGDGSAELVLSYVDSKDEYITAIIGSFAADTPVSCATIEGWVEEISNDGILICRPADIIGMRGISRLYTFDTATGELTPEGKEWTVYSYGQYAVLGAELRVEVEPLGEWTGAEFLKDEPGGASQDARQNNDSAEGYFVLLPAGTELVPIATDYYSYIVIETADGIIGTISVSYEDGTYLREDGTELISLFEYLPQW